MTIVRDLYLCGSLSARRWFRPDLSTPGETLNIFQEHVHREIGFKSSSSFDNSHFPKLDRIITKAHGNAETTAR
jgi:hypothetical protein